MAFNGWFSFVYLLIFFTVSLDFICFNLDNPNCMIPPDRLQSAQLPPWSRALGAGHSNPLQDLVRRLPFRRASCVHHIIAMSIWRMFIYLHPYCTDNCQGRSLLIDTLNFDLPQTINLSLPSVAAFSTAVGEGRGPVGLQSEAPLISTSVLSSTFLSW